MIFTVISFLEISGYIATMQDIIKGCRMVAREDCCLHSSTLDVSPLKGTAPTPCSIVWPGDAPPRPLGPLGPQGSCAPQDSCLE